MQNRKILYGNQGELGDIMIGLKGAEFFKKNNPDWDLTITVNKKYQSIIPLLKNQPYIDSIFVSDGYDNFPSVSDGQYIENNNFDYICNPMQPHSQDNWHMFRHYVEEFAFCHGINIDKNDLQLNLKRDFNLLNGYSHKYISVCMFSHGPDRRPNTQVIEKVIEYLTKDGYKFVQIGGKYDGIINGAMNTKFTYLDAIRFMLSSRLLLTCDTSFHWAASCYKFPAISVMGEEVYYGGNTVFKNWEPANPNGTCFWSKNLKDISVEKLLYCIQDKLK